ISAVVFVNRLQVPPNALTSGSLPAKKLWSSAAVSGLNDISALFLFLVYEHLTLTVHALKSKDDTFRLRSSLADLRDGESGLAAGTSNAYLQAVKQFCRWMVQDGRASESPLTHLSRMNAKVDRRHDRRALEPDEMRRLLKATLVAPKRFGMQGYERALLYRVAAETGLRAKELRSLKVSSFDFKACTVSVRCSYTKNRNKAEISLRPDTAAELQSFFAGKLPDVKAFGGTCKRLTNTTAEMESLMLMMLDDLQTFMLSDIQPAAY
ncbi:tyrosine-type recombinase/integrase, partial [Planctomycetota bacterium]